MTEDRRQRTEDRRQPRQKFFIGLKASIPYVQANYHELSSFRIFAAFSSDSIKSKKPSVARRAYRSPMPWGGG